MQFTLEYLLFSAVGLSLLLNLILFLWLSRVARHYNALTKGIDKKTLTNALEGIQQSLSTHERSLESMRRDLQELRANVSTHLQSLTLKRFNPFGDTGGDQSFILGLLDGHKDGIVITSLHSRENTRFYVKSVKGGVGFDHPLSVEEQKAIKTKVK
jgi:hypothetical protein